VQNQSGFTPIPRPAARAPEPIDQGPGEFHGALRDPHRVRDLLRFRPNEILSPDACPPSHPAHAKGQRTVMSENTHAFFAGEPMEQFPRGVGQVEERAAIHTHHVPAIVTGAPPYVSRRFLSASALYFASAAFAWNASALVPTASYLCARHTRKCCRAPPR